MSVPGRGAPQSAPGGAGGRRGPAFQPAGAPTVWRSTRSHDAQPPPVDSQAPSGSSRSTVCAGARREPLPLPTGNHIVLPSRDNPRRAAAPGADAPRAGQGRFADAANPCRAPVAEPFSPPLRTTCGAISVPSSMEAGCDRLGPASRLRRSRRASPAPLSTTA